MVNAYDGEESRVKATEFDYEKKDGVPYYWIIKHIEEDLNLMLEDFGVQVDILVEEDLPNKHEKNTKSNLVARLTIKTAALHFDKVEA